MLQEMKKQIKNNNLGYIGLFVKEKLQRNEKKVF
jgi:hypothetical protein